MRNGNPNTVSALFCGMWQSVVDMQSECAKRIGLCHTAFTVFSLICHIGSLEQGEIFDTLFCHSKRYILL